MEKLFKSGKALSLEVAVIVLVMVALAASIVAAVWMGALNFTAVATEQVTFADVVWSAGNANVSVTLTNTGTVDLYIKALKIAGAQPESISPSLDTPYLLKQGGSVTFVVSTVEGFKHNVQYMFMVTTTKGNSFGPHYRIAP